MSSYKINLGYYNLRPWLERSIRRQLWLLFSGMSMSWGHWGRGLHLFRWPEQSASSMRACSSFDGAIHIFSSYWWAGLSLHLRRQAQTPHQAGDAHISDATVVSLATYCSACGWSSCDLSTSRAYRDESAINNTPLTMGSMFIRNRL